MSERQATEIFGALAQATRLRIVRALVMAGPDGLSAGALADAMDVSPSNLSFHLRELENAQLVASRRQQRSIIYVCAFATLIDIQNFLLANCCAGPPRRSSAKPCKSPKQNGGR